MSVLVTGASGFIGSYVVEALAAKGIETHAVARKLPKAIRDGVSWHQVDLLSPGDGVAMMRALRPKRWIHLAWVTEPGVYWESEKNPDWLSASLNLLNAFVNANGQHVVMAGTCAEYDWRNSTCVEDVTPIRATSLYSVSKLALWQVASRLASNAGLSFAWARLFNLYGPGEASQRVVAAMVQAALRKQNLQLGHGEQVRDFLYVSDAAQALVKLSTEGVTGAYNVASGAPVTPRRIAQVIDEQIGGTGGFEFGARPLNSNEPASLVADLTRIRRMTNWVPSTSLADGISLSIDWWRKRVARCGLPEA